MNDFGHHIVSVTRKFRNGERNLHCDVVHITTKWVSSLTLDCNGVFAIKAYCSASGLFAECGIPNGKAVIRHLIYKFITRLNESTNDVILAILPSDIRWTSRIRHYWVKTLYVHHNRVDRYRWIVPILNVSEINIIHSFIHIIVLLVSRG